MYGPCLSPIGGGQALTSPKRHSHGELLPHHLADTVQAFPLAINLYPCGTIKYYLVFRLAIPDFEVRTYLLLSRLPVVLRPP